MSDRSVHVAVYRHLTRLYPPSFRQGFEADLVSLFADQVNDESPGRVWLRTLRDLAVSVPTQRLEAHMKRPSAHLVTTGFGAVAAIAALLALAVGTGPATPVFLVVALIAALIAIWSWRANRPVQADSVAARSWWKVFLAGPALATLTFGAMAVPWPDAIDLGDNAYWLIVITLMTSIALAATGLLLGLAAVVERRRTRAFGTSPA
jgi:hypothetical protein